MVPNQTHPIKDPSDNFLILESILDLALFCIWQWWFLTVDKVEIRDQVVVGISELVLYGGHEHLALLNGPTKDTSEESQCIGFDTDNHVLSLKQS